MYGLAVWPSPATAQPREGSLFQKIDLVRAVESSSPGSLDLFRPMTPANAGKAPGSEPTPVTLDFLLLGSSSESSGPSVPDEPTLADFTLDEVLREIDFGQVLQDRRGAPLERIEHQFRMKNGGSVQQTYDPQCNSDHQRLPGSQ